MAKKSKNNNISDFLENLPIESNIVQILNLPQNIKKIRNRLLEDDSDPLQDVCRATEVLNHQQYGDPNDTYSMVFWLPDYNMHVISKYYYNSYNGSEYDDLEFYKAIEKVQNVRVFEEVR